jgi:hypothetical protein
MGFRDRIDAAIDWVVPSAYLLRHEEGRFASNNEIIEPPIARVQLSSFLHIHFIPVPELCANHFKGFMRNRHRLLMNLVVKITQNAANQDIEVAVDLTTIIALENGLEFVDAYRSVKC